MSDIKTKIDAHGRVLIPSKIRKKLGIELNSETYLTLDGDKVYVSAAKKKCAICDNSNGVIDDLGICKCCIDKIVEFINVENK